MFEVTVRKNRKIINCQIAVNILENTIQDIHKSNRKLCRQLQYRLNEVDADISFLAASQLAIEFCCKCRQSTASLKHLFCQDPLLSLDF